MQVVTHLCGFIGKIPACGDFVRQHIGSKISSELDRWLSASSQNLYHGKQELGEDCMRFVFSAAGCEDVAVGSLIKSLDSVGRSYPLAIFTSLPTGAAMIQVAALPAVYEAFLADAESALRDAADLPLDGFRDRVASLRAPASAEQLSAAESTRSKLEGSNAAAAMRGALAGQPEGAEYYALLTLCTATSAVQIGPPSGPATVLDCPLDPNLGPSLWLTLTAARLRWTQGAISLLWSPGRPRLLLALGYASDQLLAFSASKLHQSTRLWPLTTERPDAVERARALLESKLSDSSHASVAQLAAQLTHVSC
jgi:type VI secretion system protein ImpM